jgi:hypothetical protein
MGEFLARRDQGETTMTTFRKSFTAALAGLTLATAVMASAAAEARPRHRGWAVGAGVVGALALGGLLAASARPAYGAGYYEDVPVRRCGWVERVNRWGEVVGHRRVCHYY